MNELSIFSNEEFGKLPTILENGEPLFGATESASILGFSDPHKAIKNNVEEEDWLVRPVLTDGGKQKKKFINESGLYSLIFGASKQGNNKTIQEKAKKFKRWVTSEVLPSIRKTGGYSVDKVNDSNLSPELQMFGSLYQATANLEIKQKNLETKVDNITEIVALNTDDWRRTSSKLINSIAKKRGGYEQYAEVRKEIYEEVERRANYRLGIRVTNRKQRMALEQVPQSKIKKFNTLDVIAEEKRLIEMFLIVVKDFALKYKVSIGDSEKD